AAPARPNRTGSPAAGPPPTPDPNAGRRKVTRSPARVAQPDRDGRRDRIDLKVRATADEQALAHRAGVIAMIDRDLGADLGPVLNTLPNPTKLAVAGSQYASTAALLADASRAATAHLVGDSVPRTRVE